MKIEWSDEGPPKGGGRWQRVAEALRAKPGVWGFVEAPTVNAAYMAARRFKRPDVTSALCDYAGEFEVVCRQRKVYARYLGEEK